MAQSKKGKAAEKSPQEETAPTKLPPGGDAVSGAGTDADALDRRIAQQGERVRQLKGQKAPKVRRVRTRGGVVRCEQHAVGSGQGHSPDATPVDVFQDAVHDVPPVWKI